MNYKNYALEKIEEINKSCESIWIISTRQDELFMYLVFKFYDNKEDLNHEISFNSWREMNIYLQGWLMSIKSIRPF